ncbi:WxL protein host-binding domain-containing protein [Fructilactobacillus fructivorans]|uniref:DUF3324 domain-containing protein n=1 Tax=Fructilactobacillus fructivorans TaxID=1614 RepID=A0AAE6P0V0_9LACO|nr:DUF3324 domain-containing protein [Fructilactobacillus fructivorans]KRK57203.1 hypothetical protein FC73_GL001241 [Fructilactobacillus fructivorans]KRN40448.1 hypothetical protein IV51_GL000154 [Fructilactobacillus fructivorans]KRN42791.1 hypothetical protein IV48_GL001197 [Fructilactobacillus fructivorans]QFX92313.1 DUF3324 domain-containing protein [Fructilactobacillus fructivorans]RDV64865.1 DUF3324 domain-containing protein [Fructilactobacillus fructivorans]
MKVSKKLAMIGLIVIASVLMIVMLDPTTHADTQNQVPLEVLPQLNGVKGQQRGANYFDIKASPGMKQQLKVQLINRSTKMPLKVKLGVNPATTSGAPTISYANKAPAINNHLQFPIEQLVTFNKASDQTVSLQPHQKQTVTLNLNVPNDENFQKFNGTILGGLYVVEDNGNKSSSPVNSLYSYSVGIQLKQGKQLANMKMNSVKTLPAGNPNLIKVNLANDRAAVLGKTKIRTDITPINSSNVMASHTTANAIIAPNSSFDYLVPRPTKNLLNGQYTLHLKMTSNDPQFKTTKVWNFTHNFTVNNPVSATNSGRKTVAKSIFWLVMLILLLGIIGACIYFFFVGRKQDEI